MAFKSFPGSRVACLTVLCLLVAVPARAGTAGEEMRGVVDKVQNILNEPQSKSEAEKKARLDRLKEVIYPTFDFVEMAKRSLGAHWGPRSPEEQQEFVRVFTELLENSYLESIESYDGEKVVITNEKQDREFAEVQSKIVAKKGEEYSVNYKLREVNGRWKVYDLVVENISLVNNYRSQFGRFIAKSSYEELLRNMKEKRFGVPGKRAKT